MSKVQPNKALGQHWLTNIEILNKIASYPKLSSKSTVLEIGPGLGTLTKVLLKTNATIFAVEYDTKLADTLADSLGNPKNLMVINKDILRYNFNELPKDYTVVANIPYYLTSKLIRALSESQNPPKQVIILIQKEVAQRVCAKPGDMSLLAVSAQLFFDCNLGIEVPAKYFTPAPKVDSQVIILKRLNNPMVNSDIRQDFFRVVKAGFSEKRKKLRSSLSGGLGITKEQADTLLSKASIDKNLRAQSLNINDWLVLTKTWQEYKN